MIEIQVFNNVEFGEIRTVTIDNEPYFVGKDIAEALGYANPKNAVPSHVDVEDKLSTQIEYAGQKRAITVINESGLYSLIFLWNICQTINEDSFKAVLNCLFFDPQNSLTDKKLLK